MMYDNISLAIQDKLILLITFLVAFRSPPRSAKTTEYKIGLAKNSSIIHCYESGGSLSTSPETGDSV